MNNISNNSDLMRGVRDLKYYHNKEKLNCKKNKKLNKCQDDKYSFNEKQKIGDKKPEFIRLLTTIFIGFTLISLPCFAWEGIEKQLNIQYVSHMGPDDSPIILNNNPDAANPTYEELIAFLKETRNDQIKVNPHSFIYAQELHDNAERAGYRCAWVSVHLADGEDHACNAFNTEDKGIIFLDCTDGNTGGSWNSFVNVEVGKQYIPKDAFHGSLIYDLKGIVQNYEIYW